MYSTAQTDYSNTDYSNTDYSNKVPRRITQALLRRLDACEDGITAFLKVFPVGVVVTPETLQVAFDAELDLDFLAFLLGCKQPSDYDATSDLHWRYREKEFTYETMRRAVRQIGLDALLQALETQQ